MKKNSGKSVRRAKPVKTRSASPVTDQRPPPVFVTGSILRHILVMTGTGALGLVAIFVGDLANLVFLGQLHDTEVLAAVGYASTLLFFSISAGIGLSIATTAVVSPAIGAGQLREARRLATSALVLTAAIALAIAWTPWPFLAEIVGWLGATGRTQLLATQYLRVLYPSFPLVAIGMACSAILRSTGDAKRAMYVTLSGAVINVILDPIFILWLKFDLMGAAWASVLARLTMAAVGLWGVAGIHKLVQRPAALAVRHDMARLLLVAVPAVLTNLATPAGNAIVTKSLAGYGDAAVAAWSVYGRVNPVAFGAVFALSSSIGPIVGQNFGAGDFARVKDVITRAAQVTIAFTALAWLGLALSPGVLIRGFALTGEAADLVALSCRWLPPFFLFLGFLFIANAVFNTLRHPHYATAFNWGRATLGTLPFVLVGGHLAGAAGVFVGSVSSGVIFGSGALWVSYRLIDSLARHNDALPPVPRN